MIVLNSLQELKQFAQEYTSTRVDKKFKKVVIPCRSDRAVVRLGQKTVRDDLSEREVVGVMRMLVPPHSKRSRTVRVF